jgi:hypothetical protein
MIQAFSNIFYFFHIASPCGDMKFSKVAQNRFLDDILANNPGTI